MQFGAAPVVGIKLCFGIVDVVGKDCFDTDALKAGPHKPHAGEEFNGAQHFTPSRYDLLFHILSQSTIAMPTPTQ